MMPANMKLDEAGLRSLPVNSVVVAQVMIDGKLHIGVWRRYDHGWVPLTTEPERFYTTAEIVNYRTLFGVVAERWTCVWLGDGAVYPW